MTLDLVAIELIKQLKYTYCRALDTANLDLLASLLTEDISIDFKGATYHIQANGRDEVIATLGAFFHSQFVGCHTPQMPVITVHDETSAEGLWRLADYACDLSADNLTTVGACEYTDRYRFEDGRWKIQTSSYTRLFERTFNDPDPGVKFHYLEVLER